MPCILHIINKNLIVMIIDKCGSSQSARQRGVRGTVRGMRGTQKIKKKLKKYIKKYKKIYKISKNAEIVWLVGFFLTRKKKLVSTGFEPMTSRSPTKHLIHLSYGNM